MKEPDKHRITKLLMGVNDGDERAQEELIDLIYPELHQLARNLIISKGRSDTIFQTTAIVHEAYLNLVHKGIQNWENRKHFFGAAIRAMRQFLIDITRKRKAAKRGGEFQRIPLEDEWLYNAVMEYDNNVCEMIDVDRGLERVYEMDWDLGQVADLHFFGGLTMEETAKLLNVSVVTVERRWRAAKVLLRHELKSYDPSNC